MPCHRPPTLQEARRVPIGGTSKRARTPWCRIRPTWSNPRRAEREANLGREDETTREGSKLGRNEGSGNLAGWVARTRPLAGPLSPRGPQPVLSKLRGGFAALNGSPERS